MELSSLRPAQGSVKTGKRIGRGVGSGNGRTAQRGHNGAKSRSGWSKKIGFEGGQMPLQRRIPKFGFRNINRVEYKGVNLDVLQALIETKSLKEVTPEVLVQNGLASKKELIKVLGRGEFKSAVKVVAHGFSKTAEEAITKAGGTIEKV